MHATRRLITTVLLVMAAALAAAQSSSLVAGPLPISASTVAPAPSLPPARPEASSLPPSLQPLLDFNESEVKFRLADLMDLLRDRRHEGWVLAAYPDPKTGRPLIGAGFSLDLPERQHAQSDPLNPHSFLEPSSAQLWQAAGLDSARLQQILDEYNEHLATWKTAKRFRKKIGLLAPDITNDEANQLLRIAVVQSIENARAYCRNFDRLTAPQQMALSQLVYQMGVNLEEFGNFRSLINQDGMAPSTLAESPQPAREAGQALASSVAAPSAPSPSSPANTSPIDSSEHWRAVQQSLIESQWARLYRVRAVAVIAMLDAQYLDNPGAAEQRIAAVLRPAVTHRRRGHSAPALRATSYRRSPEHPPLRKTARNHGKRKV